MSFDWRTDWKSLALRGAGFGLAATLTLFAGLALIYWYTSRPKEWNADAIKGISSTVNQTFAIDNNDKVNKLRGTGFSVSFVVENKTNRDFTLPQSSNFYKREAKSQALEEIKLTFDHSFVIPAHERAAIAASMDYSCSVENLDTGATTEREGKDCFQDAFGDVLEFVVFDHDSRLRLDLPKPTFYAGKESGSKTPNSSPLDFVPASAAVAPDNGKPWDQYWACGEAKRLVPICKESKIELEQAKASADGWITRPLPTLVRPPSGATLQPGPEICRTMYQWYSYCRKPETIR